MSFKKIKGIGKALGVSERKCLLSMMDTSIFGLRKDYHSNQLLKETPTQASSSNTACPYQGVKTASGSKPKSFTEIPGPKGWPLIGNLIEFSKNTRNHNFSDYLLKLMDIYGETVKLSILGKKIVLISNPKDMEQLYKNEEKRSQAEASRVYKMDRKLPLSPIEMRFDENWYEVRQVFNIAMKPEFHDTITLPQVTELNSQFLRRLIKHLEPTENPEKFRMFSSIDAISQHGFDAVMKTFLGVKMTDQMIETFPFKVKDFINYSIQSLNLIGRLLTEPPLFRYYKTPLYKQLEESYDKSFEYGSYLMNRFKTNPSDKPRFYEYLMERSKNEPNPEKLVETVMIGFLQAGIDITILMIVSCAFRLSHHPEYQEKIYQECLEIFGEPSMDEILSENGLNITKEHYKKLKFTKHFMDEVLRLNPFSYAVSVREMSKDLQVGEYIIPKDAMVLAMQHHPTMKDEYVPRAKEFLPERWEKGSPYALSNSFISAPFGVGARRCPGSRIATTEIHLAIINFVRHFKLSHENPETFPDMATDQALLYMDLKKNPLYFTPRDHIKEHFYEQKKQ